MKKSNKTKIVGLFTLLLTVLTLSSCITIGRASPDDIISEIDQFKEEISNNNHSKAIQKRHTIHCIIL